MAKIPHQDFQLICASEIEQIMEGEHTTHICNRCNNTVYIPNLVFDIVKPYLSSDWLVIICQPCMTITGG